MNKLLHLVSKDLLRMRTGLLGWLVLQLLANGWLLFSLPGEPGEPMGSTYGLQVMLLAQLNVLLALLFTVRIVMEDPAGEGRWRVLPVTPREMAVSKLLASLLGSLLPVWLGVLPSLLLLGCGPWLLLQSLLAVGLIQAAVVLAAFGLTVVAPRGASAPVVVIIAVLLLAYGFVMLELLHFRQGSTFQNWERPLLAGMVLLFGLTNAGVVHYLRRRRVAAWLVLGSTLGCVVVLSRLWTFELFAGREQELASSPPQLLLNSSGVSQETTLPGLSESEYFQLERIEGVMRLGDLEEPAALYFGKLGKRQGQFYVLSFLSRGDGTIDAYQRAHLPAGAFPDGSSRILRALAPCRPSDKPQLFDTPALVARLHGRIRSERCVLRAPLSGSSTWFAPCSIELMERNFGEKGYRVLRVLKAPFAIGVHERAVVHKDTGKPVEGLDLRMRNGVTVGLLTISQAWIPEPAAGGDPREYSNYTYTETATVALRRAVVELNLPESRTEVPPFSADLLKVEERRKGRVRKP